MKTTLEHFAAFPLEAFGWDDKKSDHPITGFNNWKLTVGDIRAVRDACNAWSSPDALRMRLCELEGR